MRNPIPNENFELFLLWLRTNSQVFRVRANTDINHYIELLDESIERHIFNLNNKSKVRTNKKQNERQKYVSIFKSKYLHLIEDEYTKIISPGEMKGIDQTVKKILEKNCTTEEYLTWLFEDYLIENSEFCPPVIKFTYSHHCLSKFFFVNKEKIKGRKESEMRVKRETDLFKRTRILYRKTNNEDVMGWLKQYQSGDLTLSQLKDKIIDLEEEIQ